MALQYFHTWGLGHPLVQGLIFLGPGLRPLCGPHVYKWGLLRGPQGLREPQGPRGLRGEQLWGQLGDSGEPSRGLKHYDREQEILPVGPLDQILGQQTFLSGIQNRLRQNYYQKVWAIVIVLGILGMRGTRAGPLP